jgi:hypothetical protein
MALVLVVLGLPLFTGCLSIQGEQNNFLPKGLQTMIVPLVFGGGNSIVGGLLHGYSDSKTVTVMNSQQQAPHQR